MTIAIVLTWSLVFVVVNGLFVAAEFALLAAPRTALEQRASAGDRFARRLLDVLLSPRRQDHYIATAQLGITLASLGLGMYGEHGLAGILEPYLGELSFISAAALASSIALAVLTLAHIVVGEMIPKGIALQRPEPVAKFTYWPMQITFVVLYPFILASNGLALLGLRAHV